ncbi:hypothetical protein [Aminipila terrae]|uniref:EamA domain-containing protein n=1 Tax=Aminipila terrae TaxID=2697030 RepID=A0A6P1MFY4_9FIRM|nr:hypothetical protein [Aminipila terrae]QHI72962.1 hypothetical protein Ami3637_11600 [Aminipila terrae]
MIRYYFPVMLIVGANLIYQNSAKAMPGQVNTFFGLTFTYIIAAVLSATIFFVGGHSDPIQVQMRYLNWAPFALGVSIVLLEFGFVMLYRVGWNISVGPLVCNIILAIILLIIGYLFYKDIITLTKIAGMGLCMIGLILLTRK